MTEQQQEEYRYGDKVAIKTGLYRGMVGLIIGESHTELSDEYLIDLGPGKSVKWIDANNIQKARSPDMNETKLGTVYMNKASGYCDASIESNNYMSICGALDLFNEDISKVIAHIEETSLKRWWQVASNPGRSATARAYYQTKAEHMQQALKELWEENGGV